MSRKQITIRCKNCGEVTETHAEGVRFKEFYKCTHFFGDAGLYRRTGYYPICRNCVREMSSDKQGNIVLSKFKNVLKKFNKPFLKDKWENAVLSKRDTIGHYFTLLGNPKYKELQWKDGDGFQEEQQINNNEKVQDIEESFEKIIQFSNFKVTQDMIDFWGKRDSIDDYEFLDKEYGNLVTRFENESYAQEMLFQEIALQRLDIRKKRENGDNVDKELKTLQDLLGSANIKPVQETGANASEQKNFGVLIKKWENEKPIPKPDPEWEDVDHIRNYIEIWFLGHLCKMMGVRNELSAKYEKEMKKYTVELQELENDEEEVAE